MNVSKRKNSKLMLAGITGICALAVLLTIAGILSVRRMQNTATMILSLIHIWVSNPCADLDASQMPRLFDRFYRADSSRSRKSGGYGIGLSIARAVTDGHKGKISAEYEDGTVCFTVTLPRQ